MPSTLLQKLQLKLPKLNTCAPSTKNGRFSGKNVSNAERLSTAGSTSTCPKSGLIVASSVRFDVRLYLRSAPAFIFVWLELRYGSPGWAYLNWLLETTYGSSSA